MRRAGLVCHFVDHRMIEKRMLSDYLESAFQQKSPLLLEGRAVLLVTCQRAEIYTFEDAAADLAADLLVPFARNVQTVRGTTAVLQRLSAIAAGAHSWLLGEGHIEHQVGKAFASTQVDSPLGWLGREAVRIAQAIKAQQDFRSARDYPELALEMLGASAGHLPPSSKALYVIGGGMLGQAVVEAATSRDDWSEITLVTRTPKKLRRRMSGKCSVSRLGQLPIDDGGGPFAIVMASLDLDSGYTRCIAEFAQRGRCTGIVDLSARRTFTDPPCDPYIHMYDERFHEFVARSNSEMVGKLSDVLRSIDVLIGQSLPGATDEEMSRDRTGGKSAVLAGMSTH